MKMAVVLLGEGPVFATKRGRRFHEGSDCRSMESGQMIGACDCGSKYCACFYDRPVKPGALSIGDAAMRNLKPCAACYPGFKELEVQLPADEDFGHSKIWLDGDWFCRSCRTRWIDQDGERCEYPTVWPCVSAVVMNLV